MTLDRTKKYKVGDVVFEWYGSGKYWTNNEVQRVGIIEGTFRKMHPVEVEEPLKWSFEHDPSTMIDLTDALLDAMPERPTVEGHWRHEVVSTRIG